SIQFETPETLYFYNAGIEPDARRLSPGVLLVERLMRRAIQRGLKTVDFLRGDESYKYEWGAADEPIQRLLVRRREARRPPDERPVRVRSLPRGRRASIPRGRPAHPRRRAAGDRHQRWRPGAPVLAG